VTQQTEPTAEYCCPGERYAISRAVHLGRLARYYPGCRQCTHRDDTGTLSARQVARLIETRPRGLSRPLFHDEGAGGIGGGELTPAIARDLAAAFGCSLPSLGEPRALARGWPDVETAVIPGLTPEARQEVVLAGDGRPLTAECVAAAGEGLRWSGCHVIDIGPASTACLMFAVDHLGAAGGLLVGNPGIEPQCMGLKFFAPGACPMSSGGSLETLERAYEARGDRPTRTFGPLRRFQAQQPYLAGIAPYYHALRPLRFVLDSACAPLTEYLTKLTSLVACEIRPRRTTRDGLPGQVCDDAAHFAACVDGDGETCRFLDERGRSVPAERMATLVARHLQADDIPRRTELPLRPELDAAETASYGRSRAAMYASKRENQAVFGAGSSGRFWYSAGGLPLPDALMSISLLLVILSRSDRRFSEVLDREAAVG
jgi:phosphomannomutase